MACAPAHCCLLILLLVATGGLFGAADADWRARAEQRIQQHRTSAVTLRLLDAEGRPLAAGTPLRLRMVRSAFHWGTAISGKALAKDGLDSRYAQTMPALFNTVVLENGHKWRRFAGDPERRALTDAAVAWAREQGLALRGHAMVWGAVKYPVQIDPFQEAVKQQQAGLEDELRAAIDAHIATIGREVDAYEWDVVNEPVNEQGIFRYLGARSLDAQAELVAHWLRLAHAADPDARLALNDFHILAGPAKAKVERYHELCRLILAQGAPLHAVGFQNHYWGGDMRRDPEELYAQLERFAALGLSLSATEWDCYGGGWSRDGQSAEEAHAEWLETFLTVFYSHPAATSFLVWGFWDERHWKNSAAFYRKDWTPKPALAVWQELVLGRWRSDEALTLDAEGRASARVHHGRYEARIEYGGETIVLPLEIGPESGELALRLP